MRDLESTCTSSGFSRMFRSRASSLRFSKQPSLEYPVAVTLVGWLESPAVCFVCGAQATTNNEQAKHSNTMGRIFIGSSMHRQDTSSGCSPVGFHGIRLMPRPESETRSVHHHADLTRDDATRLSEIDGESVNGRRSYSFVPMFCG